MDRRDFIKKSAKATASLAAMTSLTSNVYAAGSDKFRVGLIGCGGRGNGALGNCLAAAKHLNVNMEVIATADAFQHKAEATGKRHKVPKERCFGGFNSYKKLLETDVNVVLMATPPIFRPIHLEAAIEAGKHVFMEKPVAVDPPGGRKIIAVGERARDRGLSIVAGTQRRHSSGYLKTAYAVKHGAIGKIVGGCVMWCQSALWHHKRKPGESDADYLVRNWVSFTEMSGDHIVEQHVHNLDIANWYIGHPPVNAIGFGGRARRQTGNQFDFFSIDFQYDDECHIHSMCRQINGTYGRASEFFTGTEGTTWGGSKLKSSNNKNIAVPNFPEHGGAYVQEHIALLDSIIKGKPINEARNVAESTLTAIMGRIAAYSGQLVRWKDLTDSSSKSPWYNLALKPSTEDFEKGAVQAPPDDKVSIPGKA